MDGLPDLILALAAFITAAGAFYLAVRKWGPERRSLQVVVAKDIDEVVVKFAAKASENVSLHAEVAELRIALADLRRDTADRIEELVAQLEAATSRASVAEGRAAAAEAKVTELTSENTGLRERIAHLESDVGSLKTNGHAKS